MSSSRKKERQKLLLGIVRFRRLLEEAHRLLDLVQDGKDKLGGEYIFDRQYVVSLVDGAVVQLGRLVFNAHVLGPGDAGPLYAAFDGHRDAAARLLSAAIHGDEDERQPEAAAPPEFHLLRDAVHWMEEATGPRDASAPGLLDDVLDRALLGLVPLVRGAAPDRSMELPTTGGRGHLDLIDLEGPEGGTAEANRALDLFLGGTGQVSPGGFSAGRTATRWGVVVGNDQISLSGPTDESLVFVEACLTGEPSRDFVFVWTRAAEQVRGIEALGLEPRRTGVGHAAWSYDVPTPDLEKSLSRLGGALLGTP